VRSAGSSGLLYCAGCDRRMVGAWNHHRAHYRCKLTAADTPLRAAGHPSSIYVREDKIIDRLDEWLSDLFTPHHRDQTIEALHQAAQDPTTITRRQTVTEKLNSCTDRLAKYRAAL
jgi:site-specific DNA recombinase